MAFRIKYDGVYEDTYPYFPHSGREGIVVQPFFFDIFDPMNSKLCRVTVVHDDLIALQIADLKGRVGEKAVKRALRRWVLRSVERTLRERIEPTGGSLEVPLAAEDLQTVARLAAEKDCAHQVSENGELFCRAAAKDDPFIRGQSGIRWVAPTTSPVCAGCDLPDTDGICSRFMHPTIKGSQTVTGYKRLLAERYCDLNRPEIEKEPSRCRVGGHSCWERLVDLSPETAAMSYSPLELAAALDFLNLTWRFAFPDRRLLAMKSVESITGLVLPCSTREEFSTRLSELADLVQPDEH